MKLRLGWCVWFAVTAAYGQLDSEVWKTDATRKSIEWSELYQSVARDSIPAIDRPRFESVESAAAWIADDEPVIVVAVDARARAYPLQLLLYHEIVNDTLGARPIVITFCPLCNTALVFDRRLGGRELTFGVAGFLRKSDMVMYDRETESLWQQATGEGLVGRFTGDRLQPLTAPTVAFEDFVQAHPGGEVLSRPLYPSPPPYGESHYLGYETRKRDELPIPLDRPLPAAPKERVLAVTLDGRSRVYSFERLRRFAPVDAKIGRERYVVFYDPGMRSAMDAERISESASVGAAAAFSPMLGGERLRFRSRGGAIFDRRTGSRWTILGVCVEGELAGSRLSPVPSSVWFAFAWFAFHPKTQLEGDWPGAASPIGR